MAKMNRKKSNCVQVLGYKGKGKKNQRGRGKKGSGIIGLLAKAGTKAAPWIARAARIGSKAALKAGRMRVGNILVQVGRKARKVAPQLAMRAVPQLGLSAVDTIVSKNKKQKQK